MTESRLNSADRKPAYKVLVNGASCHGGELEWSLPTQRVDGSWEAGAWQEVAGEIACCSNGLHLTTEPARWWLDGATLYRAEYDGDEDRESEGDDKFAVRRVRLMEPADWVEHHVVVSGVHQARAGFWRAYGSASVEASGSASVEAYDSASVIRSGGQYWSSHRGFIKLADFAAAIDRRSGRPEFQVAPFSDFPGEPSVAGSPHTK